jgi:hypothetical protein
MLILDLILLLNYVRISLLNIFLFIRNNLYCINYLVTQKR